MLELLRRISSNGTAQAELPDCCYSFGLQFLSYVAPFPQARMLFMEAFYPTEAATVDSGTSPDIRPSQREHVGSGVLGAVEGSGY